MALSFKNNNVSSLRKVLTIVFLVISLVLMALYAREGVRGPLHMMQNAVSGIVSPVKFVGAQLGATENAVGEAVENATASEATLSELRAKNAELTNQLAQAEEYRLEVERLEGLVEMKDTYNLDGVAGRVVGRSTDAWNQTLTINVGENDGADTGLTVMGPTGVIGQIIGTTPTTSTVRLLVDSKSGAAALLQATRAEGIVRGSLDGLLYLEDLDADEVVNIGDVVLTSGLGGSYVRGLLIGQVVKIDGVQGDATRRIVVAPNDAAALLEEVLVVKSSTGVSAQAQAGAA